jgi:serine/threonine protein kinase
MRNDSSSDAAASEPEDERSVTAVADGPSVTRERAPEVQPGDVLAGRYQIEAVLGKGGSGVVLRAFDRVSATVVAVKVLKPGLTHDPRWEKRFSRELRLGRPIRHPNVCRIFDIGDADGYRFLTMEYATGGTLRDLVKKEQPLRPLPERLADAAGVIAGLAAIHEAGIVHRDVKPDNMLRMKDGRLVLSDFGLATDLPDSTMVSVFVGTPHYMAPEVREGDPATARSDVWSLGVVLHEIFTGRRPERRSSRSASGVSKTSIVSASPSVERAMLAVCERCLVDDPADRPEDAQSVRRLFEKARTSPRALLSSRRRTKVAFAALGFSAVVVGLGGFVRNRHRDKTVATSAHLGVKRINPVGEPIDWSTTANVLATVPGRVHCFSMISDNEARLIWGSPRQAEEVDLHTGKRKLSNLLSETFKIGCPEFAPAGDALLFPAQTSSGAPEIRLSRRPNGRDAITIVSGSDPVWLHSGEEFLYNIDAEHVALFSMATRASHLLSDPGLAGHQTIIQKIASPRSDIAAVLFVSKEFEWALAVYEGAALDRKVTFSLAAGYETRFDARNDQILVSHQASGAESSLASLDWRNGTFKHMGRFPGLDIIDARFGGNRMVLLGRHRSSDVWLNDHRPRMLTSDGENYSAAISRDDELLISKRTKEGVRIWWQGKDGSLRPMTNGPADVAPAFSADGTLWAYADYAKKSLILCTAKTANCRVLRTDEMLPTSPRFSPDGRRLAYITQISPSRLGVISLGDGAVQQLGQTLWQCPPVWTSPSNLWSFEGTVGRFYWAERNVASGARTGKEIEVKQDPAAPDEIECWPSNQPANSPFHQRLKVKAVENSKLLGLSL